jgi:competence protein ComEC
VGQLGCRGQKPIALTAVGRALAVESDRWFLWLPVFFAAGIIAYFALSNEPQPRVAAALVLGAIGIRLALRSAPLGLALAGAFLAFASGFATAKLRTEITRAPVLAHELRYVGVSGWVEAHELRDKGRARLTIRVLSLADLEPEERPACGSRCRRPMPPIAASARQWRSALRFSPLRNR